MANWIGGKRSGRDKRKEERGGKGWYNQEDRIRMNVKGGHKPKRWVKCTKYMYTVQYSRIEREERDWGWDKRIWGKKLRKDK